MGLLLAGSAITATRMEVGGLLVHPYLVLLAPMVFVWVRAARVLRQRPAPQALAFLATYGLACAFGVANGLPEFTKVAVALATMLVVADLTRSRGAFSAGAAGVAMAVAVISVRALLFGEEVGLEGLNPMAEVTNKNAFSIYAIPALYVGGLAALSTLKRPSVRWLVVIATAISGATVFLTTNRSGWLGIVAAAGLLLQRRYRMRWVLVVLLLVGGARWLIDISGAEDALLLRVQQTREGYASDSLRWELFVESVKLGISAPILGVAPQDLPTLLAVRLGISVFDEQIDPHSLAGLILGGTGVLGVVAFAALLSALWKPIRRLRKIPVRVESRTLVSPVQGLVVLWMLRGAFSREVLYAPTFMIAFGLLIGLERVLVAESEAEGCRAIPAWARIASRSAGRDLGRVLSVRPPMRGAERMSDQ